MLMRSCALQEIRSEYVRHFLSDEFVVGRDKEARLFKSIIDTISAEDVRQVAELLRSSASCVVKAVSHRKCASRQLNTPCCLLSLQSSVMGRRSFARALQTLWYPCVRTVNYAQISLCCCIVAELGARNLS